MHGRCTLSEGLAIVSRMAPHRWQLVDGDGAHAGRGALRVAGIRLKRAYTFGNDQRWGLADRNLKVLSKARFAEKPLFMLGLDADVTVDGRRGCLDGAATGPHCRAKCRPHTACRESWRLGRQAGAGALDRQGRWRIPAEHDSALRLDDARHRCFKLGLHDEQRVGCVRKRDVFYSPVGEHECESARLCLVQVGTTWQRMNLDTLTFEGPRYDEIRTVGPAKWVLVRQGQRWGVLDANGKPALAIEFDEIFIAEAAGERSRGVAAVRRGDRWVLCEPGGPGDSVAQV